jgi:ubiquinone/menaquinone biosynthesis C-methylase UbiE
VADAESDADVPSPIDLRDPGDAATWAAEADAKRPWRAELRRAIAELVREAAPPPRHVLELGAGPGLLAEAVLQACPVERYVALDFSPPMLAMCRRRVGGNPAVQLVQADFTRPAWADAVAAPFDAVIAMQAVHEIRHKRHVPRLYGQVLGVLRPGGLLAVCDHAPFDDSAKWTALYATVDEQHAALAAAGFTERTTRRAERGMYVVSGRRPLAP